MKEYGFVEFCDDYREEKQGKHTLVGLYFNDMIVPDFPALLPKFVILINFIINKKTTDIPIEITYAGQSIIQGKNNFNFGDQKLLKEMGFLRASFPLILSPFVFQKEGILEVKAELNGHMKTIGKLYIRKAKTEPTPKKKAKKLRKKI